jgi:hypothetical protein
VHVRCIGAYLFVRLRASLHLKVASRIVSSIVKSGHEDAICILTGIVTALAGLGSVIDVLGGRTRTLRMTYEWAHLDGAMSTVQFNDSSLKSGCIDTGI